MLLQTGLIQAVKRRKMFLRLYSGFSEGVVYFSNIIKSFFF